MNLNKASILLATAVIGTSSVSAVDIPEAPTYSNFDYSEPLTGTKRCALINIAMDESGSMQTEQYFMKQFAVGRMNELLYGPTYAYDHVFFCSNGFGASSTSAADYFFRTLGCTEGKPDGTLVDPTVLDWISLTGQGRDEDGYNAIVESIKQVPTTIVGRTGPLNIASECGSFAKNFILVTDEDRDVLNTALTIESVRADIADNGYLLNEVINVDITAPTEDIPIGMRMNYDPELLNTELTEPVCFTFGDQQFCSGSRTYYDVTNEFFTTNNFPSTSGHEGAWTYTTNDQLPSNYYDNGGSGDSVGSYIPLIEDTAGAVWSIGTLRAALTPTGSVVNQDTVDAFVDAFTEIKISEIDCPTGNCAVCVKPPCRDTELGNDPHITTWRNEHYEFHGQCDLVMIKDPEFADGMGIEVHVRTKIVRYWSYVQAVAIRIGNDILEIEGSADADDAEAHYWINYEYQGDLETFAGFPVTQKLPSVYKRLYKIDLGPKYPNESISIQIYKEFVRVRFSGGSSSFGKTVGLLGDYYSGKTLARDGTTVMNDFVEFGQEWQVLPSEPKLFHEVSHPQFPEQCLQPEDPRGERFRRLAESSVTVEQAEAACASLKDRLSIKDCVYDILATQDLDMVGAF